MDQARIVIESNIASVELKFVLPTDQNEPGALLGQFGDVLECRCAQFGFSRGQDGSIVSIDVHNDNGHLDEGGANQHLWIGVTPNSPGKTLYLKVTNKSGRNDGTVWVKGGGAPTELPVTFIAHDPNGGPDFGIVKVNL